MADQFGNEGGVSGHSTEAFWSEFIILKMKRIDLNYSEQFKAQRMLLRRTVPAEFGEVWLVPKEFRRKLTDLYVINHAEDRFWELGMPDNLGGGIFTRSITECKFSDTTEPLKIGYLHQIGTLESSEKDFVFTPLAGNLNQSWYVDKLRLPYPGRKATRSLGKAFTPSEGHRYKDIAP